MTKISLIGVSPVGISFALATKILTPKPIVSAYSSDSKIFDQIKHFDVIEESSNNLEKVVLNSDIIVLDLPISEIKSQFEQIKHLVKNDCIITDFSHSKKIEPVCSTIP